MRGSSAKRHQDEEEESVFISMTDMTVSFLFIVIILLIFFASQFSPDQDVVPRSDLEEMRARAEAVMAKNAELTRQNDDLLAERESLQSRIATLVLQITTLKAEAENLKKQITELEEELSKANTRIAELQLNLNALTEDKASLKSQITALKQKIESLTAEKAALSDELSTTEARIRELEAQLATMRRPDLLERYFASADKARTDLLNHIRDQIIARFPELSDIVTVESGALRFQSDQGLFAKGARKLRADREALVASIAETLDEVLPCYTTGPRSSWSATCNPGFAMIEAVQIEGHTDSDGSDGDNTGLAAARALNTYLRMTGGDNSSMLDHRNLQGQPVLSLAAYGENRPIRDNDGPANMSANRRIDLRFIMVAPQRIDDIGQIRDALRKRGAR
jgi:outer membrane protein OmpA-like peptidoglycan-associated protein